MSKKTSIIDRDYFVANYKKIIESKNKNFISAVNNLLSLENNDYLLHDKNTERITSVSENNVFLFNSSLVKDIVKSYAELEHSLQIVKESEFSDVLQDNIILFDRELAFGKREDDSLMIYDKADREDALALLDEIITSSENNSEIIIENMYKVGVKYGKREEKEPYIIRNKLREENVIYRNSGFFKSTELITDFYNSKEDREIQLLMNNGLKINKNSISYVRGKKVTVDVSFKKSFYEEAIRELTGMNIKTFVKMMKKAEMFTYGNMLNSSSYISKKSSRYTYRSINPEYTKSTQSGREFIDSIKNDYEKIMYIFKNELELGKDVPEIISSLSDGSYETHYCQRLMNSNMSNLFTDIDTKEEKIAKLNLYINSIIGVIDRVNNIKIDDVSRNLFDIENIENLKSYYTSKNSVDKSLEIFSRIQSKGNVELDKELNIDEFNSLAKQFRLRTRAGILDNKIDSYIVDLKKEPIRLNELMQKEYDTDKVVKEAIDNLKENAYYDYFEIDSDFFDGDKTNGTKEVNRKKFLDFSKEIKKLKMPVNKKGAFRIRKLKILGAGVTGVYYS